MAGIEEQLTRKAIQMLVVVHQDARIPDIGTKVRTHLGGYTAAFVVVIALLAKNYVNVIAFLVGQLAIFAFAFPDIGRVGFDDETGNARTVPSPIEPALVARCRSSERSSGI